MGYNYGAGININSDRSVRPYGNYSATRYFETQAQAEARMTKAEYQKASESLEILKDKDSITYVAHGTRDITAINGTDIKNTPENDQKTFFRTEGGNQDTNEAVKEIGTKIFGSSEENSKEVRWTGLNTNEGREKAAENLVNEITKKAEVYKARTGQDMPINLVGHSHGGNVMILVANMLQENGVPVKINNLMTLSTPVRREYQLNSKSVTHIQLYSPQDIVPNFGQIDADKIILYIAAELGTVGLATPFILGATGEVHRFENAYNLNVDPQTLPADRMGWGNDPNVIHQSTRSVGLILRTVNPYIK
jgi:hypothetical protein